jgi:hypothetical protein
MIIEINNASDKMFVQNQAAADYYSELKFYNHLTV